jgi:hypothetical protein
METIFTDMNINYRQHVLINNCRLVGYSRVVARIKVYVIGQAVNPQSATIHSTTVSSHIKNNNQ